MHIQKITTTNFKRQLRSNEEAEFSSVLKQGKEKLGNTGHSMLIVPTASLPQSINTGVGNLLDPEAMKFFDFAKQYWGINYIQTLPDGNYKYTHEICLPYSGSCLDLGPHIINMELLTKEEYGSLLTSDDLNKIVKPNIEQNRVNYSNVLLQDSPIDRALKKAFDELIKGDTKKKQELLVELKNFTQTNQEWLEPKAVFEALSAKYHSKNFYSWNEFDANFYNDNIVSLNDRKQAIKGLRQSDLGKEMSFYEFKQFLAEKHLLKAKEELNKKGLKLSGDALIGFSKDEKWANPKAFIKDCSVGYGIPALDFETPEAEVLLRRKFNNYARRYDGIRVDMSWAYATQPIIGLGDVHKERKEYGDKILNIIDDEVKKVKGNDFNLDNITHEMAANSKDFSVYDEAGLKPLAKVRNKIYCSMYLNKNWASVHKFREFGWQDGAYTLGTTNHDSEPMRVTFANQTKRAEQVDALSEILKIPKEKLNNFQDFTQARFAEPMRSKHNMLFFTEALNLADRYKDNVNALDDYKIKISNNYQDEYFKSLEKGEGFNVMDALEKAFVAEGLDKKESNLYKKIVKYKKILQSSETGNRPFKKVNYLWAGACVTVLSIFALIAYNSKKKAEKLGSNAQ